MPTRVSPWFTWHAHHLQRPGVRLLDVACGNGRHAVAAALLGAEVTALDRDPECLAQAQAAAERAGVAARITFREVDLGGPWPALGEFECVCVFNYLDRTRVADLKRAVAPGGILMMETFLVGQRALGWGPTSDEHLLQPGELAAMVAPWPVLLGREVLEPAAGDRWRAVASILARRPSA